MSRTRRRFAPRWEPFRRGLSIPQRSFILDQYGIQIDETGARKIGSFSAGALVIADEETVCCCVSECGCEGPSPEFLTVQLEDLEDDYSTTANSPALINCFEPFANPLFLEWDMSFNPAQANGTYCLRRVAACTYYNRFPNIATVISVPNGGTTLDAFSLLADLTIFAQITHTGSQVFVDVIADYISRIGPVSTARSSPDPKQHYAPEGARVFGSTAIWNTVPIDCRTLTDADHVMNNGGGAPGTATVFASGECDNPVQCLPIGCGSTYRIDFVPRAGNSAPGFSGFLAWVLYDTTEGSGQLYGLIDTNTLDGLGAPLFASVFINCSFSARDYLLCVNESPPASGSSIYQIAQYLHPSVCLAGGNDPANWIPVGTNAAFGIGSDLWDVTVVAV